jgi:3-dehydroquinate dehydratase-1
MRQKNNAVVGIVDSPEAVRAAARLRPGAVDALEWRADRLPGADIPDSGFRWILTVRHPLEGGAGDRGAAERGREFLRLLPRAAFVDVELRSLRALRRVLADANDRGIPLIASFHDFRRTPGPEKLRELALRAEDAGAGIFKIATWTSAPRDVARLLALFEVCPIPLAVMGMGPLGYSSRLLFAHCGSALNYGWLHRPNVPGQWAAVDLKKMLATR